MKRTAALLLAVASLLAGCVVYDAPRWDAGGYRGDRDGVPNHERDHGRDRDHDGTPDRRDRHPDESGRN